MPRIREIKTLKQFCLDDVGIVFRDWIKKVTVKVTESGATVIELLGKGEDDELHKCVKTWLDVLHKISHIWFDFRLRNTFNPTFIFLASTLLLDVFKHPCTQASLKGDIFLWCYMEMLLYEEINLNCLPTENLDGFIQIASKRSPLLKKFGGLRYLEWGTELCNSEQHIQRFKKLQELNFAFGNVGDCCLEIIGSFCKDLRKLCVSHCPKVTDAGIAALCVSVDHLGNK